MHILGIRVKDPAVYQSVFVHKSAVRELHERGFGGVDTYERLELLGDSIINFVVAKFLFDKYPAHREGWLTRIRTKLVCSKQLCVFAQQLRLQDFIVMNRKALSSGWNCNPRILEDCFEALVGALYLDLGLLPAKMFVLGMIERCVDFAVIEMCDNWKDQLMRYTQSKGIALPVYQMLEQTDPTVFDIVAVVDGVPCGRGQNRAKKEAEQQAAQEALQVLGVPPDCIDGLP